MRFRNSVVLLALLGCSASVRDAREVEIAGILARADDALIRSRPALTEGKYATMASGEYSFFRGSLAVYKSDWRRGVLGSSRFSLDAPLVPSLGDAHPENFGTMRAADGSVSLEPNDFDAADRAPYLWDVRRLCAGFALSAMLANEDDPTAREATTRERGPIARAVAIGYRDAVAAAAEGVPAGRVTSGEGNALLADLFRRAHRDYDARAELDALTVMTGEGRRLKRGVLDESDPENVFADLPPLVREALPDAMARYRNTLAAPPAEEEFVLLDAVREFGSGVASWSKVRIMLLVRGPTDASEDDLILELKELGDSTVGGFYPPNTYNNTVEERVLHAAHAAWSRPDADPLWGTSSLLGLPVQIKTEAEGNKTIRVARMTGESGTVATLTDLARQLGAVVARVHTADAKERSVAQAIAARIATDPEGFADEQADVAAAYALRVMSDRVSFQDALTHLGPLLGVTPSASDAPPSNLSALLGTPPQSTRAVSKESSP